MQIQQSIGAVSRPSQHRPKFNNYLAFKNISKAVLYRLMHIKFPHGRKWSAEDIINVLAYAWVRGVSVDHSSNKLNKWQLKENPGMYQEFLDGRRARAVPHQTTVNNWLRKLSKQDAEALSQAVFQAGIRRFFSGRRRSKKVVLEFDLTYLGYWGARRDNLIKGSQMVKGTHRIRHHHGALIHGGGASLYVGLEHVAKGQSILPFMIKTAEWLQQMGITIEWCAVDREYYRFDVIDEFKKLGINIITPAKDYNQLKNAKLDYLLNVKGRVQQFSVAEGGKRGKKAKKINCFLVLVAKGKNRLDAIKRCYRKGKQNIFEACGNIFGLITARGPQYLGKGFPLLIRKIYKMRWQIETAFRDNEIHKGIWRSNYDGTRFMGELGRYLLYNIWQETRVEDPRGDRLTFQVFRDEIVDEITARVNL
jgi:hypothetical protein